MAWWQAVGLPAPVSLYLSDRCLPLRRFRLLSMLCREDAKYFSPHRT